MTKTIRVNNIQSYIHTIRSTQVMLDKDLAKFYGVSVKRLNEQVKRNTNRFPSEFMFQLTKLEFENLRSQFATLEKGRGRHRKYLPHAFTEQGVVMLASVPKSNTAIKVSIEIVKAIELDNIKPNHGIFYI